MNISFLRYIGIVILVAILSFRCSGKKDSSSSVDSCTSVTETLGSPKTIEDTLNLINALPRPLTLPCFLNSLKAPLGVYAVNNTFSAQPAVDKQNPRIFIIRDKLVLSVVPAGTGRNLLEFGEFNSGVESFKGEIPFPVEGTVTINDVVNHISATSSTSTCVTCHGSERKAQYKTLGPLWVSEFIRPNDAQRVTYPYLRAQAGACNPETSQYRCDILNAIYTKGTAEDVPFPY